MAKSTILEIVQDILNDYDGDEVNSIDDTIESTQAANIIKSVFDQVITSRDWPHTSQLLTLVSSGLTTRPTHMTFNTQTSKIQSVNYNKIKLGETRARYSPVIYRDPDDFLRYTNQRDSTATNVDTVTDASGVLLYIKNDIAPSYYTSFDDETLVFDSYDGDVDNTLVSSKTQVRAYVLPSLTVSDLTVPDLPIDAFPMFIAECKSRFSATLRQVVDAKAEATSQKQDRRLSQNNWTVKGGVRYPNYGRGRRRHYEPTFHRE